MKSVFIAGSRKFFDEIEELVKSCKEHNIEVKTAGKWDKEEKDTLDNQKSALLRAFERINKSDVIFIFAARGFIGKTVAMEIAYAYAKNKEIISSEKIEELSAQALVDKVIDSKVLIKYLLE